MKQRAAMDLIAFLMGVLLVQGVILANEANSAECPKAYPVEVSEDEKTTALWIATKNGKVILRCRAK
jgi:hypothetical protein